MEVDGFERLPSFVAARVETRDLRSASISFPADAAWLREALDFEPALASSRAASAVAAGTLLALTVKKAGSSSPALPNTGSFQIAASCLTLTVLQSPLGKRIEGSCELLMGLDGTLSISRSVELVATSIRTQSP